MEGLSVPEGVCPFPQHMPMDTHTITPHNQACVELGTPHHALCCLNAFARAVHPTSKLLPPCSSASGSLVSSSHIMSSRKVSSFTLRHSPLVPSTHAFHMRNVSPADSAGAKAPAEVSSGESHCSPLPALEAVSYGLMTQRGGQKRAVRCTDL